MLARIILSIILALSLSTTATAIIGVTLRTVNSTAQRVNVALGVEGVPAGARIAVTFLENNEAQLRSLVDLALETFADLRLQPAAGQRVAAREWVTEHRSLCSAVGTTSGPAASADSELILDFRRCNSTRPMEVGDCLWQDTEYAVYLVAEGNDVHISCGAPCTYMDGGSCGASVDGDFNHNHEVYNHSNFQNGTACVVVYVPLVSPFFRWERMTSTAAGPTGLEVHWASTTDGDKGSETLNSLISFHLWLLAGDEIGNAGRLEDGSKLGEERLRLRTLLSHEPGNPVVLPHTARSIILEGCFVDVKGKIVCLQPHTVYGVVLQPQYQGRKGKTDILLVASGGKQPKTAPTNVSAFSVTSTGFVVKWQPSDPAVAQVTHYAVLMDILSSPGDLALVNVNSSEASAMLTINVSDSFRFGYFSSAAEIPAPILIVRELQPHTYFAVRLREGTRLGFGPPSQPLVIHTLSAIQPPAGPVVIEPGTKAQSKTQDIGATAAKGDIKVTWQEPFPLLGTILCYELAIVYDQEFAGQPQDVDGKILHTCKCNSVVLPSDLVPNGSPLRVRIVNNAGIGPWSQPPVDKRSQQRPGDDTTDLVVSIVVPLVFLVMLTSVMAWRMHRRKMAPFRFPNPDPEWDIGRAHVHVSWRDVLGRGAFGIVYRGKLLADTLSVPMGTIVAVKTVSKDTSYERMAELIQETQRMKRLGRHGHPNIVSMYATCMQGIPLLLILELCPNGTLKSYVSDPQHCMRLSDEHLLRMCLDVALGMQWLTSQGFVHRDLAARNCLLDVNYRVKVSDFGLARDVHYMNYYRKQGQAFLPVRWMAPETLVDSKFTSQSDVWSFGVCAWEVFSFGETPYEQLGNEEVIKFVVQGHRLATPEDSPSVVADILQACFQPQRTTFTVLAGMLAAETGARASIRANSLHTCDEHEHRYQQRWRAATPCHAESMV